MAGPVLIFDKSTLQSLNLDEAVWLDNSYLSNITPLFFIETLADLEKEVRLGRTPEQVVGNLAEKTPDMSSSSNIHHMQLITSELLGIGKVDMKTGRPHLAGGMPMELGGKSGVMFGPSPEEIAFHRWQDGEFLEIERTVAKAWRKTLGEIDLEKIYSIFKERLSQWNKPKSLEQVKNEVEIIISNSDQENVMQMAFGIVGIPEDIQKIVLARWKLEQCPKLKDFSPYFTYVFSVDLFFYFAIAADLIGRGRASHKVDMAYLYYLPFCMVFSSNDNLHKSIAPFFLRQNQTFVTGTDLKNDLQLLNKHYDVLPDNIKDRGMMSYAFYPPDENTFLLTRLWDKHMNPRWRDHKKEHDKYISSPKNTTTPNPLYEEIREAEKKGSSMKPFFPVNRDDPSQIVIKRNVRAKKGRWERFPPEVRNRKKNENGDWENTE